MNTEKLQYSNPRLELTVDNWPYGRFTTKATFNIEAVKGKERASRITVNPKNGRVNKPKKTTYSHKARIVDGSDGRTYIAELTAYGAISIRQSDMHHQQEYISDNDARYIDLLALFN
jgi:hypothetical protein